MRVFKYSNNREDYIDKFKIETHSDSTVFREIRENHIKNSYYIDEDGIQRPSLKEEYLVIRIPNNLENEELVKSIFNNHPLSPNMLYFTSKETEDYIELSYYLDMSFFSQYLLKLEKLNIIKSLTWIEKPKDKRKGTYYINAKKHQIPFNIINALYEGVNNLLKLSYSKCTKNKTSDREDNI